MFYITVETVFTFVKPILCDTTITTDSLAIFFTVLASLTVKDTSFMDVT